MKGVRVCAWALVAWFAAFGADPSDAQTVSSDDILYIVPQVLTLGSADDATWASEIEQLRSRLGEGAYVKLGFTIYIAVSMDVWNVDPGDLPAIRAALASTVAQIDAAIARARTNGIPVCLAMLTALRSRTDPAQLASEAEDIRTMQWYSDNQLASGWWTHSRYARKQRALQEAYIRELGRILADRMRQYPETLIAATGDGEVELSYDRAPDFYADYSPFAVAEFRDWIRHGGLYATGGALAGQGHELGLRYAGDQSPAIDTNADGHTLNGDLGTSFQTWNLLHFNWSLADAYSAGDPGAIPLAQYQNGSWLKLPGGAGGGFDAPRVPNRGNPWWELWMLFKQRMIWRHNQEFAKWITTSPDASGFVVPRERWYSYQIPADYLFNGSPDNPNERFFSSASPWWSADVSPYGSLGITSFNVDFGGGNVARTLINVVPRIAERGLRWGVVEWHPGAPPDTTSSVSPSLDLYRSEMALIEQYRPSLLVPFAWGDPLYRIQDTGFETALREMIGRIKDQPPGIVGAGPSTLRFGAVKNGASGELTAVTSPQEVAITFTGASSAWTATSDQPWLQLSNASATDNGRLVAAVVNPNNVIGGSLLLTATITVRPSRSSNVSISIPVQLTIRQSAATVTPFGGFDTPTNGATGLQGSFAVTGWALDDIGIDRVEIWRNLVPGESTIPFNSPGHPGHGKVFIATGFFLNGARPDVQAAYSTFPQAHRAGWGYLLLTWGLWNQGNGAYTLYAFAFDMEGNSTTLGTRTIQVSNQTGTKPFGAIDTPAYGQTVSGGFWNYGWALTPNPNSTDPRTCAIADGNVFVSIDSGPLVAVSYGDLRPDIASWFPGFSNGVGAGGAYYIDTRALTNGTHQIGWYVVDNCGRADGLGSRFFSVLNGSQGLAAGEGR